jgi:dihydroorotate dehydrogenase
MNFFYSAGVKGYGNKNRWWHNYYKFLDFPIVTKTITLHKKIGYPFAIIKIGNSIWNKVSLHNYGIKQWIKLYNLQKEKFKNVIVSIAGTDDEINIMIDILNSINIKGIELNFSCPNVKSYNNKIIPKSNQTKHKLYLKLNHTQDPYNYDLNNIISIRVNSIPTIFGGLSGKIAQKKNWKFIEKFNKEGLNIAGASCININDFKRMKDIGCKETGLGTITLINPEIIKNIKE